MLKVDVQNFQKRCWRSWPIGSLFWRAVRGVLIGVWIPSCSLVSRVGRDGTGQTPDRKAGSIVSCVVDGAGDGPLNCRPDEIYSCFEALDSDAGVLEQFRLVCETDASRARGRQASSTDREGSERAVQVLDGPCLSPSGAVRIEKTDPVLGPVAQVRCP